MESGWLFRQETEEERRKRESYKDVPGLRWKSVAPARVDELLRNGLAELDGQQGVGNDGEVADAWQYSVSETLDSDLQRVLDGRYKGDSGEVYIGETSNFLTDVIGADALTVTMPVSKAYSAMATEEEARAAGRYREGTNYHGLGPNGLKRALVASENPVVAFADTGDENGKRSNHIVLVTDEVGADGNIVVVEALNTRSFFNGRKIDANKVITSYDRAALSKDIEQAGIDGRLLYFDKKRSQAILAGGSAANWRSVIREADFANNIRNFWENVKWENSGDRIYTSENAESSALPEWKKSLQEYSKQQFSVTEYTAEEKRQHVKDAVDYFGRTYKWSETGYITTDGKRLDFSGRHEGGPGGYRTVDHRDIGDALGEDYGGGDYSGSMVQFMSEGNIRISPESGGINLSVMPTEAQLDTLSDFISKQRGEVILDLDTPDGSTVFSTEYPRGTHANKVLNDIRAYFEEGKQPYVSDVARFRYSVSEGKTQDELLNFVTQFQKATEERFREVPRENARETVEDNAEAIRGDLEQLAELARQSEEAQGIQRQTPEEIAESKVNARVGGTPTQNHPRRLTKRELPGAFLFTAQISGACGTRSGRTRSSRCSRRCRRRAPRRRRTSLRDNRGGARRSVFLFSGTPCRTGASRRSPPC